ncbi:hypothetical protein M433DRAFT_159185 [Acidomyces richmondensis BFW]|nr:hypothetical protein M433DRAFT_159185 [Acidomyces richmondensis BFW]
MPKLPRLLKAVLLLAALPQHSHYPIDPAYTSSSSTDRPQLVSQRCASARRSVHSLPC